MYFDPMASRTIKHLTVEAVMPDGVIHGKTIGAGSDDPEELLSGIERMVREAMQREFPEAQDVRSSGWVTGEVMIVDE